MAVILKTLTIKKKAPPGGHSLCQEMLKIWVEIMTACSSLIDSLMRYFHIMCRLTVYQKKKKKKKKQETVQLWPCFSNSISEKINSGLSDVVPVSKGQTPPSSTACHRLTTFYGTGNLNGGWETVRDYHSRKCAFPVACLFVSWESKAAQNSKFDLFSFWCIWASLN